MKIRLDTARRKLSEIPDHEIFYVTFIKRTTGEDRVMKAMKGVKDFVHGNGPSFNDDAKNLLRVFDVEFFENNTLEESGRSSYRHINLETIISFEYDGKKYEVNDFPLVTWFVHDRFLPARTEEEAKLSWKRMTGVKRMPNHSIIKESKHGNQQLS